MAFKEYKGLNLSQVADEVLAEWEKNRSFEKSISLRKNASKFIFYAVSFLYKKYKLFLYRMNDSQNENLLRVKPEVQY